MPEHDEPAPERAPQREPAGERDDDSPVERYRDSPGLSVLDDDVEPVEPNEPG